jgi:hypothetical protein
MNFKTKTVVKNEKRFCSQKKQFHKTIQIGKQNLELHVLSSLKFKIGAAKSQKNNMYYFTIHYFQNLLFFHQKDKTQSYQQTKFRNF